MYMLRAHADAHAECQMPNAHAICTCPCPCPCVAPCPCPCQIYHMHAIGTCRMPWAHAECPMHMRNALCQMPCHTPDAIRTCPCREPDALCTRATYRNASKATDVTTGYDRKRQRNIHGADRTKQLLMTYRESHRSVARTTRSSVASSTPPKMRTTITALGLGWERGGEGATMQDSEGTCVGVRGGLGRRYKTFEQDKRRRLWVRQVHMGEQSPHG